MAVMCQLHRILQGLAFIFCVVKACNVNIVCSNSSVEFTIQQYVDESDTDFDSDNVQWTIASNSVPKLTLTCSNNFTLQDTEKYCDSATPLRLNIIGCQRVRAKSLNITIDNCIFTSPLEADWQTMLNFSGTNATIKNCSFTSMNNDTTYSDPMIVISETILSLVDSEFVTLSGKMIHVESKSEITITYTTFCNSTVTEHEDHPALIKVLDSNVKLESSIVKNNSGGLIVSTKDSQVSIVNCEFVNNSAWECTFCASQSSVSIENTTISENVGNFSVIYLVKTISNVAGEVKYSNNNGSFLVRSSYVIFNGTVLFENCRQKFDNSSQAENYRAQGTLTIIHSTAVLSGNVSFLDNHSNKSGGAMYISETLITFYGSLIVAGNQAEINGGGAFFYAARVSCSAECSFANNTASHAGGAISAVESVIALQDSTDDWLTQSSNISIGRLNVSHNTAEIGGGIYLEINSKIYGFESNHFHYEILFTGNSAKFKGGAIYVNDSTYPSVCASKSYVDYDVHTECFFQILHDDEDIGIFNSNISFNGNTAKNSESILYGGLLDRCTVSPMATIYNKTFHSSQNITPCHALTYFQNVTDTIDEFESFASESLRVCFCHENKPDCHHEWPTVNVMRGEEFNINVTVVDQVNRSITEKMPISIYLVPETGPSTLGKGQQLQYVEGICSPLNLSIFSPNTTTNVTIVVYVDDSPCMDAGLSNRTVEVSFKKCNCPVGFQEDNRRDHKDRCDCVCHSDINNYVSTCNSENATFLKKKNSWIGFVNNSSYLVHPSCPYDFCKPPMTVNISLNNSSDFYAQDQCAYNRAGLLCGQCREGLWLSITTPNCLNCTSQSSIGTYIAVMVGGSIGGIAMILFLLMFNVTVVQGTINGLIFYANIVLMSRSLFFPSLHPNFLTVFVYFINTRIGIDRCLPYRVDEYQKVWHSFTFPIYTLSLVVAIILLSKYSSRCTRIVGKRNPVATLATIILLIYTVLLQAVIDILGFAVLKYPKGSRQVVWLPDASVKYFKGKHIPLFFVAVFILIIGLIYTFLLFAWQWLIRAPNTFMFRWLRNTKLHSFMEAYHAPYKPKYRYWTGLLLFIRILLNIIVMANTSGNPRTNLLAITILIAFLFLLKAYLGDGIYKRRLLDYLETTYYFNLMLFSLVSFNSADNPDGQIVAIRISVSITFVMTMCTLLYHIHYTLCEIKCYKKASESILQWISRKKVDHATDIENARVHYKPTNTEVWLTRSRAASTEQETCKNLNMGACTLNLSMRDQYATESQVSDHYTADLREPLLEQL